MKLELLTFGKLRAPGLRDAADYYQKLIQPWVSLRETELKPLSVPDKSPASRARIQDKESALLREWLDKNVGPRGAWYVLDETGRSMNTQGWSKLIREWEGSSLPAVALIVGSSLGFGHEFRSSARGVLSLGPQTLPHELARVVLCEQLYRAWSVVRGHPYHNEG